MPLTNDMKRRYQLILKFEDSRNVYIGTAIKDIHLYRRILQNIKTQEDIICYVCLNRYVHTKYHELKDFIHCKIGNYCASSIFLNRGPTLKKYTKVIETPVRNIQHTD